MKEIRLHGRGGMGVVKASQLVVKAAVDGDLYGQSIPATYEGLKEGGMIIINTTKPIANLHVPAETKTVVTVDASGISEKIIGRNMPNTAMLGAFVAATGLVDKDMLFTKIDQTFGPLNKQAAEQAAETIVVTDLK